MKNNEKFKSIPELEIGDKLSFLQVGYIKIIDVKEINENNFTFGCSHKRRISNIFKENIDYFMKNIRNKNLFNFKNLNDIQTIYKFNNKESKYNKFFKIKVYPNLYDINEYCGTEDSIEQIEENKEISDNIKYKKDKVLAERREKEEYKTKKIDKENECAERREEKEYYNNEECTERREDKEISTNIKCEKDKIENNECTERRGEDSYSRAERKEGWISCEELYDLMELSEEAVYTHNCMERLVCGQLGSIASRMALDNQDATTIDGRHKGAGIVKAQSVIQHVQYFFTMQNWIETWFKDRGMDSKGYDPSDKKSNVVDPDSIDFGDDEEEITIQNKKTVIEFQDIHKEIDNNKDQKFNEV